MGWISEKGKMLEGEPEIEACFARRSTVRFMSREGKWNFNKFGLKL